MTGHSRSSCRKDKTKTNNINLLYKRIKNSLKFGWFSLSCREKIFDFKLPNEIFSVQQTPALHPTNITVITMVPTKIEPNPYRQCIKNLS